MEQYVGGERIALNDHQLLVQLNGVAETAEETRDDYGCNPNVVRAVGQIPRRVIVKPTQTFTFGSKSPR